MFGIGKEFFPNVTLLHKLPRALDNHSSVLVCMALLLLWHVTLLGRLELMLSRSLHERQRFPPWANVREDQHVWKQLVGSYSSGSDSLDILKGLEYLHR